MTKIKKEKMRTRKTLMMKISLRLMMFKLMSSERDQ